MILMRLSLIWLRTASRAMIDKLLISLVFSIAICGFDVGATEVGDVSRGLKVFKKCTSCHAISPDARKRVGPALINIVNAPAGQVGEYKYSKALRAAAANGLHWTPEALDSFLKKPKAFLPKTKMSFRGLKNRLTASMSLPIWQHSRPMKLPQSPVLALKFPQIFFQ